MSESEFEQLIQKFMVAGSPIMTEDEFKRLLNKIWVETGPERRDYYAYVQCKLLMLIYKELLT